MSSKPIRYLSRNQDDRPQGAIIDMVILHYTGMKSCPEARGRLCDPAAKVSAHYLIDEDGSIDVLVDEERQAWHAGASGWGGQTGLNANSIGIEIVNPGHEWGYRPFPEVQMRAVEDLCRDIKVRRGISRARFLGHSDVAPARKEDPGELFDWPRLARRGIGIWPDNRIPAVPNRNVACRLLEIIGYDFDLATFDQILLAFQRHFEPASLGLGLDAATMAMIQSVANACQEPC